MKPMIALHRRRRRDEPRRAQRAQMRRTSFADRRPVCFSRWCLCALVALLGLLALPGVALAQVQEGPLVVPAGQQVAGSVATVARDIRVDGAVAGDVTSWSGAITIAGTVGGDVVSYGGQVNITATGRVGGHILASGGGLQLDPGAVVGGQAISGGGGRALASVLDLFNPSAAGGGIGLTGRVLFGVTLGVLMLAFSLLLIAFWPRRIMIASATLWRLPARSLAIGLLTTLVLGLALLPLAALLLASVVGLPLIMALLALALAPYVYGLAVLARATGARISARAGSPPGLGNLTIGLAAALALLIVVVAAIAPLWGLALFYLLASPGLGAAILSRGGMMVPLPVDLGNELNG